jgi:LAS superfamily LD-carboxypeptidase LdcB
MGAGRVPGPLGMDNAGTRVNVPGPLVAAPTTTSLHADYEQFRQAVLDRQIAHLRARAKTFFPQVADAELEVVEGKYRMRKAAAKSCRALLVSARAALATDHARGDARARQTQSIGVTSAYRDYDYDAKLWRDAFKKYYDEMITSHAFAGDELGVGAIDHMLNVLLPLKAPPGYSNHSNGTAVDFKTTHAGIQYTALKKQRHGWRTTWLHPWLVINARTFGFQPLKTEEWHWDYK